MPAAEAGFVHLHVHTAYSLREGALSLGKLIDLAVRDLQPALAVTDTNNLFAALEFSEKAAKAGLQPIAGAQLRVDFGDGKGGAVAARDDRFANIVLLAKTEAGYRNLMRLASRAFLDTEQGDEPHLTLEALAADAEELIALTGGPDGALDRPLAQGRPEQARARLATLERLYGERLYIEVQRHSLRSERDVEPQLLDLAYRRGLPLVATNEPYFAQPADFEAHDALLCIAEGAVTSVDDRRRVSPEHCFKTRAQMCALFADLQEATANTLEIARRVRLPAAEAQKPIMPRFVQGAGDAGSLDEIEAQELRREAIEGLEQRLAAHGPAPGRTREEYAAQLDFELSVIEKMRFPGYFLIVADFIKWPPSPRKSRSDRAADPAQARSSPIR